MDQEEAPSVPNQGKYADLMNQEDEAARQALQESLYVASKKQPDRHARVLELSKQTNLPPALVDRNFDEIERRASMRIDYGKLMDESPGVARFLEHPDNAAIARDDLENLSRIEKGMKFIRPRTPEQQTAEFLGEMGQAAQTGWNNLNGSMWHLAAAYGLTSLEEAAQNVAEYNKRANSLRSKMPDYAKEFSEVISKEMGEVDESFRQWKIRESYEAIKSGKIREALTEFASGGISTVGEALDVIKAAVTRPKGLSYSVVENLAHTFPSLATGFAGAGAGTVIGGTVGAAAGALTAPVTGPVGPAVGASIGASIGGRAGFMGGSFIGSVPVEIGAWINESLAKRGVDITDPDALIEAYSDSQLMADIRGEAERKGLTTAAVDQFFNAFAGKSLAGARGLKRVTGAAKDIAVQSVGEGASEYAGQVAAHKGDFSKASLGEALQEGIISIGHSFGETVIGASLRSTLKAKDFIGAAEEVVQKTEAAIQAAQDAQVLGELGQAVKDSKLAQRMPEKVAELIDVATEGQEATTVYFQTQAWDEYWSGKGLSPAKAAEQILGDGGKAYHEAKATGSDLEIPLSSYIANVATTEHFDGLIDAARTREDGMTLGEAREFLQSLPATMEELANEAMNPTEDEQNQLVDQIINRAAEQLKATGIYSESEAKAAASILDAFRVLGERYGIDPQRLMDRYRLHVQGQAVVPSAQQTTFNQSPIDLDEARKKQEVEAAFDAPDALERYAAMEGSEGGRDIDPDLMRSLYGPYAASREGAIVNLDVTGEPSARLARKAFTERLKQTPDGAPVVFMAGGSASGKTLYRQTYSAQHEGLPVVFDTTLSNYKLAKEMVDEALAAGHDVQINFIYSPFDQAIEGNKERFRETGRLVDPHTLARTHAGAIDTVLKLIEDYEGNSRFQVDFFQRNGGNITYSPLENLAKLRYNQDGQSLRSAIRKLEKQAREALKNEIEEVRETKARAAQEISGASGVLRPDQGGDRQGSGSVQGSGQEAPSSTEVKKFDQSAVPAAPFISPLGFYSQLEAEVSKMDFKSIPAKDLANRIKNIQGIKKDELEVTGLLDWLALKEEKVTKEEVIEFIRNNGVKLEQIVLAEDFAGDSAANIGDLEWSEPRRDRSYEDSDIESEYEYYSSDDFWDDERLEDLRNELAPNYTDENGDINEDALSKAMEREREERSLEYARESVESDDYVGARFIVEEETTGWTLEGSDEYGWYNPETDSHFDASLEEAKVRLSAIMIEQGEVEGSTLELIREEDIGWREPRGETPSHKTIEKKAKALFNKERERFIQQELSEGKEYYEDLEADRRQEILEEEALRLARHEIEESYNNPDNARNKITIRIDHPILEGQIFGNNKKGWTLKLTDKDEEFKLQAKSVDEAKAEAIQVLKDNRLITPKKEATAEEGQAIDINAPQGKSRWARYRVKGGENYREVLLTLPNIGPEEFDAEPHFKQKNILAHVRLTDRVDDQGRKVLFIEEMQSDWHQRGRERGYKLNDRRLKEKVFEANARVRNELSGTFTEEEITNKSVEMGLITAEEAAQFIQNRQNLDAVPDAPFKNTEAWAALALKRIIRMAVEQGYDAVAISPAEVHVERWGTDSVSWVKKPGGFGVKFKKAGGYGEVFPTREAAEANVASYSEDKRSDLEIVEVPPGWLVGSVEQVGGNAAGVDIEGLARMRGKLLERHGQRVTTKEELKEVLVDTLNRERNDRSLESLTDSIWKQMQEKDSGVKAPRKEGMEFFYDNLLPKKVAPAILKKLDKSAKVTVGKVETEGKLLRLQVTELENGRFAVTQDDSDDVWTLQVTETREEAEAYIKDHERERSQDAWIIPLTDQIKAKAMEGFSLFQGLPAEARGRIQFGPHGIDIQLLKDADKSTFLHEMGHFYLEVLADLASDENMPQQIKDDFQTVLNWMGISSREEMQVEHHEKWARAFEAYLMEGKAPSSALREAFARFKAWLTEVYRKMRNLNVELTSEVRAVMDRLLATDEEIAAAQAEMSIEPLFPDPESVGMTGKKAEAYRRAMAEARQAAEETLAAKLLEDVTRQQKAEYKEQREKIRKEVEAEAHQMNLYKALALLQKGTLPDGSPLPDGFEAFKLSREALVQDYGKEFLKRLPRPYVYSKDGGIHPDLAAEILGFTSGDELVTQLANSVPLDEFIDRQTEAIMRERYPDLLTDPKISEEAIKALHNDKRAQLLRLELEHLASNDLPVLKEVMRRVVRRIPSEKAVREQAEKIIAARRVKDIKPHAFRLAEVRAAKEAGEALAKGDIGAAFEAKRKELLNHELFRAATEAQAEVQKIVDYMKRFSKASTRERIGKAGEDYLDQIDVILDRFDFKRGVSLKTIERRKALVEWIRQQEEEGLSPNVPQRLLDEAYRQHYKDTAFSELQEIRDTVKQIEHFARLKNKLLKAKEKRELDEAIDLAASSISAHAKKRPREVETRLPQHDLIRMGAGFLASHRKFSSLIREMDGFQDGGAMWELLVVPLNEAANREAEMNEAATIKLKEIFSVYTPKDLAQMYKKQSIPEAGISLTKMGQLMVALNWGNLDNRTKLMDGYGWTEEQVSAILDRLDERDWSFVQNIWDYIDTYWPESRAISQRVSGVAPEKVEASEVQTKFGTFRGGYFPLKYDDRQAPKAYANLAKEAAERAMRGGAVRSTTKHGHRESRVSGVRMPIRLDFGVIFEHVGEVIHDQTHYEMLIDANKLLGDKRLQDAIISHYGDIVYGELRDALQDVAAGNVPAQTAFERSLNWLRAGASIAAMGWNLMTALQQPLGLTQSIVRVGPKWVAKGVSRFIGDATRMENTTKWIHEQSSFMRLRAKTQMREINEIRNSLKLRGRLSIIEDSYFWLITKAQMIADIPTWLGAYEKAMAEGFDEAKAIALADQAVLDAQGGGQVKDLAKIQRGSPLLKIWTNFYSFFNTTYNLTVESAKRTDFKSPTEVGLFAVDMLMLYTVPAILGALLREAIRGGDDDEDLWEKLVREQASYLMGTMVGLRELGGVVQGFRGYEGPAGTRFFSQFGNLIKQIEQGETDEAFWRALNQSSGILFHYPAGQVERTVRGFTAIQDGRTQNPAALLTGPPQQ